VICPVCGVEFKPKKWGQIYCTVACKKNAQRERMHLVYIRRQPHPEWIMEDCFGLRDGECKALKATYCAMYEEPCPFYKPRKRQEPLADDAKRCVYCGNVFNPTKPYQKYCSKECCDNHYRARKALKEINGEAIREKHANEKKQKEECE